MKILKYTLALMLFGVVGVSSSFAMEKDEDKKKSAKEVYNLIINLEYVEAKDKINKGNVDVNCVHYGDTLLSTALHGSPNTFGTIRGNISEDDIIDCILALLSHGANIEYLTRVAGHGLCNIFHQIGIYYNSYPEKYKKLTEAIIQYCLSDKPLSCNEGSLKASSQEKGNMEKFLIVLKRKGISTKTIPAPIRKMIFNMTLSPRKNLLRKMIYKTKYSLNGKTAYEIAPKSLKKLYDEYLKD